MYKDEDILLINIDDVPRIEDECASLGLELQFLGIEEDKEKYKVVKIPEPSAGQRAITRLYELKKLLKKYKEDVEQVELFGLERPDYAEKKKFCHDAVLELRELEKTIKAEFPNYEIKQ